MSLCNTNIRPTLTYGIAGLWGLAEHDQVSADRSGVRFELLSLGSCWSVMNGSSLTARPGAHAMMLAGSAVELIMEFTRCRRRCDGVQRSTDTGLDWMMSVERAALLSTRRLKVLVRNGRGTDYGTAQPPTTCHTTL